MSLTELSGRIGRARWLRLGWFKSAAPLAPAGTISETLATNAHVSAALTKHARATAALNAIGPTTSEVATMTRTVAHNDGNPRLTLNLNARLAPR